MKQTALRFARKGEFIPNFELKFPKSELDIWTIENRIQVQINDYSLYISPLELQIPFKLFLGSEKDIEDAKYLYVIFKDYLDRSKFTFFLEKLDVVHNFMRYIDDTA